MTAIALFIFVAHHRLVVRQPGIRQILERLFDFVVLQFDTTLERKKAVTFEFSKAPALPILYSVVYPNYLLINSPQDMTKAPDY